MSEAPRILGAVYADEADVPVSVDELRHIAAQANAGFELTEAERERVLEAMRAVAPVFEQMRRAFENTARAMGPLLAQIGESFRRAAASGQGDYALAPPRPGGKPRGPGRRGRAAQRSPYGPQRRR